MIDLFEQTLPTDVLEELSDFKINFDSENGSLAVNQALENTVLCGGKRLRPLLTHVFANYFNLSSEQVSQYAECIEKIHGASLAHDDVIDNAVKRRGIDTLHIQTTNKKAILAGDYLLADVIVTLSKLGNLEVLKETALTIKLLSLGEWLQADLIESRDYTAEKIEKIAYYKTASVISWCAVVPAILAGLSQEQIEKCRSIGIEIGNAFQEIDDSLDFSSFEESKKDSMADINNNLVNSVVFEYFTKNKSSFQRFQSGESLGTILESAQLEYARDKVRRRANERLALAKKQIEELEMDFYCQDQPGSNRAQALNSLFLICDLIASRSH